MILKQLWDTAPMRTSKKVALLLALVTAILFDIGIQLVNVDKIAALEFIYSSLIVYQAALVAFLRGEVRQQPQPKD